MENTSKVCLLTLAIISMVAAEKEIHSFESRYGEGLIARDDLTVDREAGIIEVAVTPIKGKLTATVNLHDFRSGYTALRDDVRERCYILRLEHTMEEMLNNFEKSVESRGFFGVSQTFTCTNKQFVSNSEMSQYGERIASFCKDYEVVYTEKRYSGKSKRSVKMMSGTSLLCGFCIGWC